MGIESKDEAEGGQCSGEPQTGGEPGCLSVCGSAQGENEVTAVAGWVI